MVMALIAEMIVETVIVTANWRKNWPVMPLISAGHEDGAEHQPHGDDWPGDLFHRLERGGAGLKPVGHLPLDVFQHDDCVVDHDADRQHQPEERNVVQAESQRGHHGERADERDGHVDHRQDHRPPVLQEKEHDQADNGHGGQQRAADVRDRIVNVQRRVVSDVVIDVVGELGLQLLHLGAHAVGYLQGIRAGKLVEAQADGGLAVEAASDVVVLRACVDTRQIAKADQSGGGRGWAAA